ncbi:calcium-binding protein [Falsiroseomonas sp. HC035]|uniref:calcium-binding protein n=1 Tax=Falsiroseomonas sp. HC035 TaxID=3390999 RepID=UPI003D322129
MPKLGGTSEAEVLEGTAGADTLDGLGGNDTLNGGAGNDVLVGGAGDDRFVVHGRGFGSDVIQDFSGGDIIDLSRLGISALAHLTPFLGRSVFGDATLSLTFGGLTDRLTILGLGPADLTASAFLLDTSLAGGEVAGTAAADVLFGGLGNDRLSGSGGADTLFGGAGADTLAGGAGNATLTGGAGDDRFIIEALAGGARTHTITDFAAGDLIDLSAFGVTGLEDLATVMRAQSGSGPGGTDVGIHLTVQGASVRVVVQATQMAALTDASFVFATDPAPRDLMGTAQVDVLFGGAGNDTLQGGGNWDTLLGGGGDDRLVGGWGNDLMLGGAGADTLIASGGTPVMAGGPGDDLFILFPDSSHLTEEGEVRFTGYAGFADIWDLSPGDVVDLSATLVPDLASLLLFARQDGADVVIDLGDTGLVLRHTALAGLGPDQFVFSPPAAEGRWIFGHWDAYSVIFGGAGDDTIEPGSGQTSSFGGAGDDSIGGYDNAGNDWLNGQAGNDTLIGGWGHDTLDGGDGNNLLNGGGAQTYGRSDQYRIDYFDIASYRGFSFDQLVLAPYLDSYGSRAGLTVTRLDSPGGSVLGSDTLIGIERIETRDRLLDLGTGFDGLFAATNRQDGANMLMIGQAYAGPVDGLDWQLLGSGADEIFGGTDGHDFINALGGDDAVDGGGGHDVIDGNTGSNFLTGNQGRDVFFLDGRGGSTTWSTITDWQQPFWMQEREQLSIWGFRPGLSVLNWAAEDGTAGYRGVTLHADLNGDGTIDTSVTWAGRTQADLPTPLQVDGLLWFT